LLSNLYGKILFELLTRLIRVGYGSFNRNNFSESKHKRMINLSSHAERLFLLMTCLISESTRMHHTLVVDYEGCKLLIRPFILSELIMVSGLWEIYVKEILLKRTEMDDVVIEVGANIGIYAIPLAKKVKKVIALEPHPITVSILKKSVELNNITNMTIYQDAAAASKGTISYELATRPMNAKIATDHSNKVITVNTTTLDLVSAHEEKVDWLIIDVEGSEVGVLNGGTEFFKKFSPRIIIEVDDSNIVTIHKILEIQGYTIQQIFGMYYYAQKNDTGSNFRY
jgi:FkbM family methyltransferase